MDVHKSFVITCVAAINELSVTTYNTFIGDLHRLAAWLAENDCRDVCMESTGMYWISIYNILEPTCNIILAHPKYVKAIQGRKHTNGTSSGSPTFSSTTLSLGALSHRQISANFGICSVITGNSPTLPWREKQGAKLYDCLQFQTGRCVLKCVGKATSAIMPRILENSAEKLTAVSGFRTKGMNAPLEQVLTAVDGEICKEQAEKLRIPIWTVLNHANSIWNRCFWQLLRNTFSRSALLWQCRVSNPLPQSAQFPRLKWICPYSHLEAPLLLGWSYATGQEIYREEETVKLRPTSHGCLFSALSMRFVPRNS